MSKALTKLSNLTTLITLAIIFYAKLNECDLEFNESGATFNARNFFQRKLRNFLRDFRNVFFG